MTERELFENHLQIVLGRLEVVKKNRMGQCPDRRIGLCVGDHHHFFDGGQVLEDVCHPHERIDRFAFKKIPVRRKNHLGLNLAEPIQHPFDAEIRRAGGPGRPHAGGRQHGNHRFGHVGHEADHPVAGDHAHAAQGVGDPGRLVIELGIGQAPGNLVFPLKNQCGPVIPVAKQILCKIEPGT